MPTAMISALKKKKKNREENPVDAVKKESERVIVRATFGIGVAALCLSACHVPSVAAVWSSRPLLRRSTIGGRHTRVVFPWLLYLAHTVNASHTPAHPRSICRDEQGSVCDGETGSVPGTEQTVESQPRTPPSQPDRRDRFRRCRQRF